MTAVDYPVVPDQGFTEQQLAAASKVIERALPGEPPRLAYLSGSLAAGLGHELSDVDLYLESEDARNRELLTWRQDGQMVQLNWLTPAEVDLSLRACSSYQVTPSDRWQISLDETQQTNLIRLSIGTVLHDPEGRVPPPQVRRGVVRQLTITFAAKVIASFGEDVLGMSRSGDPYSSLLAGRMAVELAMEAALTACDDLYLGRKFLWRRFTRHPALAPLVADAWQLLQQPDWPLAPAEAFALAERRMIFAGYLCTAAGLRGWDTPAEQLPADWRLVSDDGPARTPWACPIRFGDSWGMAGPDTGFRVSEGVVQVWMALTGTPVTDLRQRLTAEFPAFAEVSGPAFEKFLHRLSDAKAAILAPTVRT